jgi:pantoate--beta-alanine ligase
MASLQSRRAVVGFSRSVTRPLAPAAFSTSAGAAAFSARPAAPRDWAAEVASRKPGDAPLVCRSVADMRALRRAMDLRAAAKSGRLASVGFVPTMGALHKGHLDLVGAARTSSAHSSAAATSGGPLHQSPSDFVVASIFVNPTQFAPHEDLSRYPRTWDRDYAALHERGVDAVFAPTASDMYPVGAPYRSFVTVTDVDVATPEGGARPGFFRGVATVVSKLFNIVQPTHAVFGQKDGIQCIVVRQIVRDLNIPVRVDIAPTTREQDGLAMSSRNAYLTPEMRALAPVVYKSLMAAKAVYESSALAQSRRAAASSSAAATLSGSPSASSSEPSAEVIAQQAAVRAAGGAAGSWKGTAWAPPAPLDPLLKSVASRVEDTLRVEGKNMLTTDYITFSDAATGAPIARLEDSTARNGAVMLSLAVRAGTTRLLDNILLVGDVSDLGIPAALRA